MATCLIYTEPEIRRRAERWLDESIRHARLDPDRTPMRDMVRSAARLNRAKRRCRVALLTTFDRAARLYERGVTVLVDRRGMFVIEQDVISRPLGTTGA